MRRTSALGSQPLFFVVGSPRSGTTLLRNLLRSHPNLWVAPESHFIPLLYRAWGEPQGEESRRRLIERVLDCHWVRGWRLKATVSDFDGCTTFSDIVERLLRIHAGPKAHARLGDKTPAYAREIPTLCRIFPGAQFIHIIRDGRDVALSLKPMWFGCRHPFAAAEYWRHHVVDARRDGTALGPARYVEVRYEELLRDTEGVMRRLCEFLHEPYDPRVLVPATANGGGAPARRSTVMVSLTEVVTTNFEKWRTGMTSRDLEIFETAAGDLLSELGYERATNGCRIGPARRTYWRNRERIRRFMKYIDRSRRHLLVGSELRFLWTRVRSRVVRRTEASRTLAQPS